METKTNSEAATEVPVISPETVKFLADNGLIDGDDLTLPRPLSYKNYLVLGQKDKDGDISRKKAIALMRLADGSLVIPSVYSPWVAVEDSPKFEAYLKKCGLDTYPARADAEQAVVWAVTRKVLSRYCQTVDIETLSGRLENIIRLNPESAKELDGQLRTAFAAIGLGLKSSDLASVHFDHLAGALERTRRQLEASQHLVESMFQSAEVKERTAGIDPKGEFVKEFRQEAESQVAQEFMEYALAVQHDPNNVLSVKWLDQKLGQYGKRVIDEWKEMDKKQKEIAPQMQAVGI